MFYNFNVGELLFSSLSPIEEKTYPLICQYNLIKCLEAMFMYETELRCPHCHKLVGKTNASEKSIAKVLKVAPKQEQPKTATFENKCPRCNKLIYIKLGFID